MMDPGPTGKVGNLIFYSMYGKKYVRAMPENVKQSKATKTRSTEFGRASTIGGSIRKALSPVIVDHKDQKMQTRLVSVIYQWLNRMGTVKSTSGLLPPDLYSFPFSEKGSSLRTRWKVGLQISQPSAGRMQIKIPAFTPKKSLRSAGRQHLRYL